MQDVLAYLLGVALPSRVTGARTTPIATSLNEWVGWELLLLGVCSVICGSCSFQRYDVCGSCSFQRYDTCGSCSFQRFDMCESCSFQRFDICGSCSFRRYDFSTGEQPIGHAGASVPDQSLSCANMMLYVGAALSIGMS